MIYFWEGSVAFCFIIFSSMTNIWKDFEESGLVVSHQTEDRNNIQDYLCSIKANTYSMNY